MLYPWLETKFDAGKTGINLTALSSLVGAVGLILGWFYIALQPPPITHTFKITSVYTPTVTSTPYQLDVLSSFGRLQVNEVEPDIVPSPSVIEMMVTSVPPTPTSEPQLDSSVIVCGVYPDDPCFAGWANPTEYFVVQTIVHEPYIPAWTATAEAEKRNWFVTYTPSPMP